MTRLTGFEAQIYILGGGKARQLIWPLGWYVVIDEFGHFIHTNSTGAKIVTWEWTADSLECAIWEPYIEPKGDPAEDRRCATCGGWKTDAYQQAGVCTNTSSPFCGRTYGTSALPCKDWYPIVIPPSSFFIVWSPEGATPPEMRYATHDQAREAAEGMALLHPNQKFYPLFCNEYCVSSATRCPLPSEWERAWDGLQQSFDGDNCRHILKTICDHDPRRKTEVRPVWKETKEREML